MSQTQEPIEEIVSSSDESENGILVIDIGEQPNNNRVVNTEKNLASLPLRTKQKPNEYSNDRENIARTNDFIKKNDDKNYHQTENPPNKQCPILSKNKAINPHKKDPSNLCKKALFNLWKKNAINHDKEDAISQNSKTVNKFASININDAIRDVDCKGSIAEIIDQQMNDSKKEESNDMNKEQCDEAKENENFNELSFLSKTDAHAVEISSGEGNGINDDSDKTECSDNPLVILDNKLNVSCKISTTKFIYRICLKCQKINKYFKKDANLQCYNCGTPMQYLCKICKSTFDYLGIVNRHVMNVCARDQFWNCTQCSFISRYKKQLKFHIQKKHIGESKCGKINNKLKRKSVQTSKEITTELKTGNVEVEAKNKELEKSFSLHCTTCNVNVEKSENAKSCSKCNCLLIWKCLKCDYNSKSYCGIYDHIQNYCNKPCRYCETKILTKEELELHEERCPKYSAVCHICLFKAKTSQSYKKHMRSEHHKIV